MKLYTNRSFDFCVIVKSAELRVHTRKHPREPCGPCQVGLAVKCLYLLTLFMEPSPTRHTINQSIKQSLSRQLETFNVD